jgi:outer membrane protein assembly factor BamB
LHDDEEAATLGRMYFFDAESGHVTWRCPLELQGQVERNPHDVWQVSVDADSAHKTYFNIDTNEHTWVRPAGLGVDPDRKPGDEWLATIHLVSGDPYYTNLDTGEVVWERPKVSLDV